MTVKEKVRAILWYYSRWFIYPFKVGGFLKAVDKADGFVKKYAEAKGIKIESKE